MRIGILGMGVTGQAVSRFLLDRGEDVIEIDAHPRGNQVSDRDFDHPLDQLIVSPGISPSHPIYHSSVEKGVEVIGEVELALRHVRARCVGITGTNGKTTATLLLTHVLKKLGFKAEAAGNIGSPLIDYVGAREEEILVVELSSFQLETVTTPGFEVSAILNITPDHLDRYDSFSAYANTKKRLIDLTEGKKCSQNGGEALYFMAAHFGVSREAFDEAARDFVPPPHRLELVKEIDGISFYNDSKGTNIDAVAYAIANIAQPKVILVGGKDKGLSFESWKETFQTGVKLVIAFGEARGQIQRDLSPDVEVKLAPTLEEAVDCALEVASRGDAVVLSPGCSSFDAFKNYAHRGDVFREIVENLEEVKL